MVVVVVEEVVFGGDGASGPGGANDSDDDKPMSLAPCQTFPIHYHIKSDLPASSINFTASVYYSPPCLPRSQLKLPSSLTWIMQIVC